MLSLQDLLFCALECERQQSGEMSVYNFAVGLEKAREWGSSHIDPAHIRFLAAIIEPSKNEHGFRQTHVFIRQALVQPPDHTTVYSSIERLCDLGKDLSPEEFYKTFEQIHPFIDGNGRVGALLFNWMNGSLDYPIAPPDLWKANGR